MKRILIVIALILGMLSMTRAAGVKYFPATTGIDTVMTFGVSGQYSRCDGLARSSYKVAMTSSGGIGILYGHGAASNKAWRIAYTTNAGSTWGDRYGSSVATGTFAQVIDSNGGDISSELLAFGDSLWGHYAGDNTPPKVRAYNSAFTEGVLDTVFVTSVTNAKSSGNHGGIGMAGGNLIMTEVIENATNDSVYTRHLRGALAQGSTYYQAEQVAWSTPMWRFGLTAAFTISGRVGGFLLKYVPLANTIYYADTVCGQMSLTATGLPVTLDANLGNHQYWMIQTNDTCGLFVWQSALTSGTLYARAFYITSSGGWTSTKDRTFNWAPGSTAQTLATAGFHPAGFTCDPVATSFWGTDTVVAAAINWSNPAVPSTRKISYWLSGDKGLTWGAAQDVIGDTAAVIWNMQMNPRSYKINDTVRFAYVFADSAATAAAGTVVLDKLGVGTPAASSSKRRIMVLKKRG